jgi:hypothetical protein
LLAASWIKRDSSPRLILETKRDSFPRLILKEIPKKYIKSTDTSSIVDSTQGAYVGQENLWCKQQSMKSVSFSCISCCTHQHLKQRHAAAQAEPHEVEVAHAPLATALLLPVLGS